MHTMTATIGRLRALLLDEGWSEDHRADALRTLAEIEAAWDALLAPDVEAALGALLGAMRGVPPSCAADVADVLRPLVEDRARLAREVERLRGERRRTEQALRSDIAAFREDRNAARAELARLTSDLDSLAQDVGQALCAATLRPGETITDQRPHAIVSLVVDLVGEKHAMGAEIARLTAAPGEAWERLREAAKMVLVRREADHGLALLEIMGEHGGPPYAQTEYGALRAALAAVELRAVDTVAAAPVDPGEQAYQPTVEIERVSCSADLLLASNRGDVPPEVRPPVPGCDGGHPGCGVCDALDETAGVEEVDPSAAKIAAVPSPACNVDHTTDERPRVLGGECADCLHRPPLHEPTCTKARCSHPPRAWTEEQIRAAWYRCIARRGELLSWERIRAALRDEAV